MADVRLTAAGNVRQGGLVLAHPMVKRGLLIFAAMAFCTTTIEVATVSAKTSQGAEVKRTTTKKKRRTTRRYVRRRPPVGGVYARSAIVLDPATGQVLFEKNSDRVVPIASLTKLMTAMVFLEQRPDLERSVEVTRTELRGGGHTQLRNRELVRLGDLLHMSLMCSDNVATRVLARESGLEHDEFLDRMNQKSEELGLTGTRFTEFTGLDERNTSTAADVARLLQAAADDDLIREISTTRAYSFRSATRHHSIPNTNRLLYNRRLEIVGGKTGFISESCYCLATWVRTGGRDLITVVLGAPTNATRFADVLRMVRRAVDTGLPQSS
jgi:D-alanyl-D-alanine endopeptidase (penicillin-binding protein 7)